MQTLVLLISATVLVIAVAYTVWTKGRRQYVAFGDYPAYGVRPSLLTTQEIAYYKVLARAIGPERVAFPKVRLSDVLEHPGPNPQFRAHWVRVQRRCADLLVCTLSLTPVLAVKFGPGRRGKDDVLEQALEAAGLPLLRVKLADHYDLEEVQYRVKFALAKNGLPSDVTDAAPPPGDDEDSEFDYATEQLRDRFSKHRLRGLLAEGGFSRIKRWTSDLWLAARRGN